MKTRIISGVVLAAVGILTIALGGPLLMAVLLFCSEVGMYELYKAMGVCGKDSPFNGLSVTGYAACAAYWILLWLLGGGYMGILAALCVMALMTAYVVSFPAYHADQAVGACFGFFYVTVMLSCIFLIRMTPGDGGKLVWLVFISAWGADTCAYFAGRFLGRHKMAPVLSPKKTVEGAAGGIIGAAVFGVLFALIFNEGRLVLQCSLICALGAIISIFGDLGASAIKRDRGIKDYGTLIPGHGGIMDRFDSVIFTAPVIYFLMLLTVG